MKIEEFYAAIGGDYEGVMSRLMNEAMIGRFILKFLDDLSYDNLKTTLLNEDYKEAFRAAHTLKGVSQNLGFTKLYEADAELTERLRGAQDGEAVNTEGFDVLLEKITEEYNKTVNAIKAI